MHADPDADTLDRAGYLVVFEEDFTGPALAADRWVAQYLPQWSTPERSAARYDLDAGVLTLRIDADQPPWLPDGEQLRVSNIQTGSFSGPAGSDRGTHRHRPGLTVRTAQPTRRLYTPSTGMVEARLRASADPACMLAVWLVGFEETTPEQSGEICVAELYGHAVGPGGSTVRMGIKAHHDPGLREDMADVMLDIDATDWHTYAAAWTAEETRFYVDDRLVRSVPQGLDYPLQLMIDLFEFPAGPVRDPALYPKTGKVASVRGYRPTGPGQDRPAGSAEDHFSSQAHGVPTGPGRFVRVGDISPVEFVPGLAFRPVLGDNAMANFVSFAPHTVAPTHVHEEEQIVVVLEGELEFHIDGESRTLRPGDVAVIPPWVPHGAHTLESACVEVDMFTPPRRTLLEHADTRGAEPPEGQG